MTSSHQVESSSTSARTNGSGAAAILSAGIGCFILAMLSVAADNSALLKNHLAFYKPTGALSGVTTMSILIWLVTWCALEFRWQKRTVAAGRISAVAITLLGLGLLLTFPPFAELF